MVRRSSPGIVNEFVLGETSEPDHVGRLNREGAEPNVSPTPGSLLAVLVIGMDVPKLKPIP
eukprot:scaffold219459_cov46-Prasinocladus_malaysianus.AAC.1